MSTPTPCSPTFPLSYLADPYTITGHLYAMRRDVFGAIGGLDGMDGRFDDDHELARRIQRYGLRNVQTPVIYDVDNYLSTLDGYTNQMRRWFIIPRQTMAPFLTPYQQFVSLLGSVGNLIPPLLAVLTLLGGIVLPPFVATMALYAAVYGWCEHAYLARSTPLSRWPWVLLSSLIAPIQALTGLIGGSEFYWRGQHIRLHPGGRYDVIPDQLPGRGGSSGKTPFLEGWLPGGMASWKGVLLEDWMAKGRSSRDDAPRSPDYHPYRFYCLAPLDGRPLLFACTGQPGFPGHAAGFGEYSPAYPQRRPDPAADAGT